MLTVGEASGLIAAGAVIVQYILPASIAIILVRCVGTENTAVTWSVLNRYLSNTIWPHILRADAVSSRHLSTPTSVLTWISTIGAALLVLASVLAPLGLSEQVVPGGFKLVQFEYVKDPTPWGAVTMPRPNFKFSRICEVGLAINCPGQYQGTYMNETTPGSYISVDTDENSTVNSTIPRNYTTMFRSATADQGNTISGMFDLQFRRWAIERIGVRDKGAPFVVGKSRDIEGLMHRDEILLKEGLIVDMRDSPGIGFRNHTIPLDLDHGGLWSEDITWIEPVTQCADTNMSVELRTETSASQWAENRTEFLIDRGAFTDLQNSDLESRPWTDNQTLNLFAHAYKAARMHNVLVASSYDISLPLNGSTKTLPPRPINSDAFSYLTFGSLQMSELKGVGGKPPFVPGYTSTGNSTNSTRSTGTNSTTGAGLPHYPDGIIKLTALNYTAIQQICEGYYRVSEYNNDARAVNITYPAIRCGAVFGAGIDSVAQSLAASTYTGVQTSRKNIYVCASAYKASIKTVNFRYNGTGGDFTKLEVLNISPKSYANNASKPLWAVEHSFDKVMRFDPLWGLVNDSYETTLGFHTLRKESLWLPTGPSKDGGFGEMEGYDALAASGGFLKRLGNLYKVKVGGRDITGDTEYALAQRWAKLSQNQTTASAIPSLILTDGLAAGLVGTKTSYSSKYVEWPASLAVDDSPRGYPQGKVQVYRRVIRYDIRYAIPSFLVLALFLVALVAAIIFSIITPKITRTMQRMYNQTSAGRLATTLLGNGKSDPNRSSDAWAKDEGGLRLAFGKIAEPEGDKFISISGRTGTPELESETVTETTKAERGHLLPGSNH